MSTVEEVIFSHLTNIGIQSSQIRFDHRLADDLGLDSFDVIELIIFIEEKFEIDLMDWLKTDGSQSVGEIIEMLRSRYKLD